MVVDGGPSPTPYPYPKHDRDKGMRAGILAAVLLASASVAMAAPRSVILAAPDDPAAIRVQGVGDGRADDTDAVQRAIDAASAKTGHGLVFLPSGRYRLTRSILVPPG